MTMRIRTKNGIVATPRIWKQDAYWTATCGVAPAWSTVASGTGYVYSGFADSMTDTVIPGFSRRRALGEIFNNSMYSVKKQQGACDAGGLEVENTSSSCAAPNTHYQRWKASNVGHVLQSHIGLNPDGTYAISSSVNGSDMQAALTEASTSCLNKRGRADTNLYEALAEVHKTLGLYDAILGNAFKVISAKAAILQKAKDTASAYLAYRYGLMPIMKDIEAVNEGLAKAIGKVRISSRASVSFNQTQVSSTTYDLLGMAAITVQHNTNIDVTVRAWSLDEYLASVASNVGFTTKGLVTLPWELLPYSFVVDWFANVGDLIGALVPVLNANQLSSGFSVNTHAAYIGTVVNSTPAAGRRLITPLTGALAGSVIVKTRSPGLPAPGLTVKTDFRFDQALRASDAIALIVQKLR